MKLFWNNDETGSDKDCPRKTRSKITSDAENKLVNFLFLNHVPLTNSHSDKDHTNALQSKVAYTF